MSATVARGVCAALRGRPPFQKIRLKKGNKNPRSGKIRCGAVGLFYRVSAVRVMIRHLMTRRARLSYFA
jgi:hypothetical protein